MSCYFGVGGLSEVDRSPRGCPTPHPLDGVERPARPRTPHTTNDDVLLELPSGVADWGWDPNDHPAPANRPWPTDHVWRKPTVA